MNRVLPVLLSLLLTAMTAFAAEDLTVLPPEISGSPPAQLLKRHLRQQADAAFARRMETYEQLKMPDQLAAYQDRLKSEFVAHLGGFPERTPLEPVVVARVPGEGYVMERVIFQSQPRHYVTAILFLPTTGKPPYPAVVIPCGHSSDGKASNQRPAILLAKNGIAAMSYDPIGQGERYQFLDAAGKPMYRSTSEHTIVGTGSIPLGRGTATYRIWDGMRAIDYLAGRKEIDPQRIGATGCSGGGTLTSYLMALDERVACAAPSCYITSLPRLLDTIGPQDAEQNIHGQIAFGMDHADYLLMRAPRPTLICAATRDFFDITGTWNSFRQAKRFYTRLGFSERVNLVESDTTHGYPREQREAMARWMRRWLLETDDAVTETDFTTHSAAEVQCSPRGQVMLIPEARSVVDLNLELEAQLAQKRAELWKSWPKDQLVAEVRRLAGIRPLVDLPSGKPQEQGTIERPGYRITKLTFATATGIPMPGLLFAPEKGAGKKYLYLHGGGKGADAQPGGPIEDLVKAGHTVLAVDPCGTGETGTSGENTWAGGTDNFFVAYMLGQSLVGLRAEDILIAARYLRGSEQAGVNLVAIGAAGPAALHAAAVESGLFGSVRLSGSLRSWGEVVRNPAAPGQLAQTIHGSLTVYDLSDLAASLPKGKLTIE